MKGQLPWSVERLRGQGIELFSRSEAFFFSLHDHLSLVVYLQRAAKYQRPAWRLSKGQKGIVGRGIMASQWPPYPW
jgi:hypothetical protein